MPLLAFRSKGDIDSSLLLHLLVIKTMVFSYIYAFSAEDRSEVKRNTSSDWIVDVDGRGADQGW